MGSITVPGSFGSFGSGVGAPLNMFPASVFNGLKLEVKRNIAFDNIISRAASGREVGVSWRELPIITFDLSWEFLDDNLATTPQPGGTTVVYTEFDRLTGFFQAQHGDLVPFYLKLSDLTRKDSDYQVWGQIIATGNGTTTNFQLCRTVGPYLEVIQTPDPNGTVSIYFDGVPQSTGWTLLANGIIQFTSAPGNGVVISADIPFLYTCRFNESQADFDQLYYLLHECQTLKLRTVIL